MLCDTHDTSILIVDTYVMIPVSTRSRYTAVYRSSTKYREMAQVSRVLTIPCCSYHLATCMLQACDAETISKVTENHNYPSTTNNECTVREQQSTSTILFHIFALAQHYWLHSQNGVRTLRHQDTSAPVPKCPSDISAPITEVVMLVNGGST